MNHKTNRQTTKGFTLIELMLAMTFISILLLTIALTIVQIATIYNRGIIAKELNESSRSLTTEFTQAFTASGSFSLDPNNHHYVPTVDGGRLCIGNYSYIWNYGSALSPASQTVPYPNPIPSPSRNMYVASGSPNLSENIVKIGSSPTRYEISLVKAPDSAGSYCIQGAGGYPNVKTTGATELLRTGDHGIVLHYLDITTTAKATDALSAQQLYKVTFVLGTSDVNALTGTGADIKCIAPGLPGADPNYCSVQTFSLVLRVVNGVN